MYNQPMAQLDPTTQALAQAVEMLKQRAKPRTPGGLPTIANQTVQAAQTQMQPQMPPQGGQQGLPGVYDRLKQAVPSMQQNAQEQQVGQMAQQVAQHMQQQQQPPGVTGLPANNMGFAEGGIVPTEGYAGGGGVNLDLTKLYGQGAAPSLGIAGALPTEPETPEVAELRMREAERAALAKQRIPELYARGTETVKNADTALEAAQQQALKERGMERLMSVLSAGSQSRYGAGEGYLNFQNAARKADALYAQQKQLNAMQQLEQDKYRYSLETGSNTAAQDALKNIAGIKDKLTDNAFQIKQLAETTRGNDLRATVDREQIASAEKRNLADIVSRERTAELGIGKAEKAQNLRQYLDAMNSSDMKKLGESVAAAEKRDSSDAPALRKQLNEKRASYAKYYKLTPQEAASAFEGAGASASTAGAAELKYNPKTGKIE